jgi:hypothetical protein
MVKRLPDTLPSPGQSFVIWVAPTLRDDCYQAGIRLSRMINFRQ